MSYTTDPVSGEQLIDAIIWRSIEGTADYLSEDLKFRAVYKRTERGLALYWTFPATLPDAKRTQRNALSVGGLPERLY